ncbi:STAS domain-containing protein [Actinoplanes sp. NPDC051859]|uniref:STAS domain-containing protein n=1 Tax=Actinoplanes sp. NPDC051859 TaxID=3363909 RepID=UPI0037956321
MAVPAINVVFGRAVTRTDLPALSAALTARLQDRAAGWVVCDVARVQRPDLVTVEALALVRVIARRHAQQTRVAGASPHLLALIRLFGLADVLTEADDEARLSAEADDEARLSAEADDEARLSAEVSGEPEQRKQASGVEEVVHPGDPPG